jgi:hypothetical protein
MQSTATRKEHTMKSLIITTYVKAIFALAILIPLAAMLGWGRNGG